MKSTLYLTASVVLCSLFLGVTSIPSKFHPLSDEFIDHVNSLNATWTAGRNFRQDISMDYIYRLMGVKHDKKSYRLPRHYHRIPEDPIPENFDGREQWPHCPSLKKIRDQGGCGSCWAFGAVESMTDRICIASGGKKQFHFSAEDMLTCCLSCGDGCDGGFPGWAWDYWVANGIVSGGPYNSKQGCLPYEIEPCEHHTNGSRPACNNQNTPPCKRKCEESYEVSYEHDLHKGSQAYSIGGDTKQIQIEIMRNGPVEGSFRVYADFIHYKTGVYEHVFGGLLGNHAIKILGWGVDEATGKEYWLCANSWNYDWGDGGFFKILRGQDECKIEDDINCGLPKIY